MAFTKDQVSEGVELPFLGVAAANESETVEARTAFVNFLIAVQFGVAEDLVKFSGKVDVNAKEITGLSPLHLAINRYAKDKSSESLKMIETLLNSLTWLADRNIQDSRGDTPLHYAAKCDLADVAIMLLAGQVGYIEITRAKVDVCNKKGETPLHTAVAHGAVSVMSLLLKQGAQMDIKDTSGQTVIDIASAAKNTELVALLKAVAVSRSAMAFAVHNEDGVVESKADFTL